MTSDPNRPFFRLGARLFLGEIPREEFARFIGEAFRNSDKVAERTLRSAFDGGYSEAVVRRFRRFSLSSAASGSSLDPTASDFIS